MDTDVQDALGIDKATGWNNADMNMADISASGRLIPLRDVDIKGANTYPRQSDTLQKFRSLFTFENDCHKKNFIQTFCVYFNVILLGWTYGQLGTAFPDFQLILDTNVKQTSLVFTMNSVGYMFGSVGIGFLYDRISHLKLLVTLGHIGYNIHDQATKWIPSIALYLFPVFEWISSALRYVSIINGMTSIVLPWCNVFGLFLFVRLVDGILCGGRDAGGNSKVASCWGTEGRQYMQALHFSYALGGIISPIVTSFFLAPIIRAPSSVNATVSLPSSGNATISGPSSGSDLFENVTYLDDDYSVNTTIGSLDFTTTDEAVLYGETKVHIAFVITGLLTSFSGILYIALYRKGYENVPPYSKSNGLSGTGNGLSSPSIRESRVKLTRTHTVVFLVLLAISIITYATVECKYQSFIMPFVLMQLNWTKSQGAFLISLLWAFYGIGRFSGILISRFVLPQNLLITFLGMVIASSIGLGIGSYLLIDAVVWIMVPFAGFAISIIFPTLIVWTQENALKINGKMGGFFQFIGAMGFFIDPLYIGVLMENVSPMYFNYLNIAESSLSLLAVLLLLVWVSWLRKKAKAGCGIKR